jgi:hypothetical protein
VLTFAAGAGGTLLERSGDGRWRSVNTRTTADLYTINRCGHHYCAAGAGGALVDCARQAGGEMVCIPRRLATSVDLRATSWHGDVIFGRGVMVRRNSPPVGLRSPAPDFRIEATEDEFLAAVLGVEVGRGGLVVIRTSARMPSLRVRLPSGADLLGVADSPPDAWLVGARGTIVHLAVDGIMAGGDCPL